MLKKIIAIVLLLSLITFAIFQAIDKKDKSVSAKKDHKPDSGLTVGVKAPDFELKTLDGKTVKLSHYKGKKVMLNFWATWCPPCKAEMPDIETFYKKAGNDVVILAVNIDTSYDVKGFVEERDLTFPILLDDDNEVSKMYQVASIPTTYFIDQEGLISSKFMGPLQLEKMQTTIDSMK